MVSTFSSRAGCFTLADCLGMQVAALCQLAMSPAGRSLSRSGEDGLSIPTGWFAVASHDTSDMLTTSGVSELLACANGKRTFY